MKKNLLFAGLLLAALPICAQKEGPTFSASDPYPIFEQGFEFEAAAGMSEEEAFKAWQQQEIGRIDRVQYYIHKKESGDNLGTSAKPWENRDEWQRGPWRDTTLILRNDVMVADNPDDSLAFQYDSWSLVSQDRSQELAKYGVTGGKKFFQYVSTDTACKISNSSAWSNHLAARYRRNLFVRGIEIQDTTSYRFTAYVTAHKDGELDNKPTLYADVMRGHFASEKPFTMGVIDKSAEYKYNRKFEKDVVFEPVDAKNAVNKQDEWSKVVFMTYYINDSVADDYVFVDGYWWDAEWSWTSEETGGEEWNYIVQPDKYFVRVGFASDSTTFGIDDISLTKSWIGGCEYNGDKIRVDFGYKTNLSDLCEQAYDRTNISSIEILGDYFEVWGLLDLAQYDESYDGDRIWYEIPIRSAEYQKDGYMYMFTDIDEELFGGEYVDFNVFDSVLVSFKNPVDQPEKKLVYDEKSSFPRAWDVEWIKAGRNVMGFTNEPATPNPAVGEGIWSMKDLPPVFQGGYTYESGSFQMDGSLRSLDFKFSRSIAYDDKGDASDLALMKVQYGNAVELWTVSSVLNDTIVEFERPATFTKPLAGDVEFTAIQLFGALKNDHTQKATAQGEDATISYSFGPQPAAEGLVAKVSFESKKADKEVNQNAPTGFSLEKCYVKVANYKGLFTKGLQWGVLNQQTGQGNNPSKDNCPKLSYGFYINATGDYDFQVVYARVSGDNRKMGVQILDEAGKEIYYSEEKPTNDHKAKDDAELKAGSLDTVTINLADVAAGSYEMVLSMPDTPDGTYYGTWRMGNLNDSFVLFSLTITEKDSGFDYSLSIGYPYTSAFAAAQAMLNSVIAKVEGNADQYAGIAYNEGKNVAQTYADFNNPIVTAPSKWTAATKALTSAKGAIDARIALVDEMKKQSDLLQDTLDHFVALDEKFATMVSWGAGQADLKYYEGAVLNASEISDDSVKAVTKIFKDDQAAIVAQYGDIEPYQQMLALATDSVNSTSALVTLDEYGKLKELVEYSFNEFTSTSEEIKARIAELCTAYNKYIDAPKFEQVELMYLKGLADLADSLGFALTGYDLTSYYEGKEYDKIESFYKNAIKYQVYTQIETVDSLPLNALIKNGSLWANVKLADRMDVQWPAATISQRDNFGRNMVRVRHQYNNDRAIAVMILNNEYTDLLPYWTATAGGSGNKQASVYDDLFSHEETFFDGRLSMDWGSKITINQSLEDLPVGTYSFGVGFYTAGSADQSSLDVTVNNKKASAAVTTANDTIAVTNSNVAIDGNADLTIAFTTSNTGAKADDVFLTLNGGKDGADYGQLAGEAKNAIESALTDADAPEADAVNVEYYTPGGILVDAPQEGEMYVRKMYFANEDPISEMVLFK